MYTQTQDAKYLHIKKIALQHQPHGMIIQWRHHTDKIIGG